MRQLIDKNMINTIRDNFFGIDAGEECHFYFSNATMPFTFCEIGITHPNKDYFIHRSSRAFYVIEYIVSGKGFLEIDNNKFPLHPGDIYIVEPGYEHSYYPDQKDPFLKKWMVFSSKSFDALFHSLELNQIFVFHDCFELERYFEEMLVIGAEYNCSDHIQFKLGLIATEIAYTLAQKNTAKALSNISKLALDTKAILDSYVFSKIEIAEIAEKLNYSSKQISREFKKYYGITPYKYFLNNKIEMAKRILISTKISIKEITNKLCFNNQHSFCNAFKEKVGISPTMYRRKH